MSVNTANGPIFGKITFNLRQEFGLHKDWQFDAARAVVETHADVYAVDVNHQGILMCSPKVGKRSSDGAIDLVKQIHDTVQTLLADLAMDINHERETRSHRHDRVRY